MDGVALPPTGVIILTILGVPLAFEVTISAFGVTILAFGVVPLAFGVTTLTPGDATLLGDGVTSWTLSGVMSDIALASFSAVDSDLLAFILAFKMEAGVEDSLALRGSALEGVALLAAIVFPMLWRARIILKGDYHVDSKFPLTSRYLNTTNMKTKDVFYHMLLTLKRKFCFCNVNGRLETT